MISVDLSDKYEKLYEEAMSSLDRSILFKSRIHGEGHIERVINLGAHIAQNESLSEEETRYLLLCCSYHDIGRRSDWYDRKHGSKSAKMIARGKVKAQFDGIPESDMAVILAAISAHSDKDSRIHDYEKAYGVSDHEKFGRICSCLKDADNLDRVRIKDLDVKYLRHEKSRQMAEYAQKLFDDYKASHL